MCHWRDETISPSSWELAWLVINKTCLQKFQQHNVANQWLLNILGTYSHLSATHHLVPIQPFKNNVRHSPAPYHSFHSQDFHEKDVVRSVILHLHHPVFLFISVQLNPAHPFKLSLVFKKSLFSHSYWHAVRFYYDSMVYIRWAIGLSWFFLCVYIFE